jgi:hypothetical protein
VAEAQEDWGELNTGKGAPALFVVDCEGWGVHKVGEVALVVVVVVLLLCLQPPSCISAPQIALFLLPTYSLETSRQCRAR